MTGDAHPIHYDDEYGKKTRYGRRLAHGIVAFVEQTARFRAPAFIGDTVYPEHEVVGLERPASSPWASR